ncbi:Galactose oxidase [Balamuthia mandrillaris]
MAMEWKPTAMDMEMVELTSRSSASPEQSECPLMSPLDEVPLSYFDTMTEEGDAATDCYYCDEDEEYDSYDYDSDYDDDDCCEEGELMAEGGANALSNSAFAAVVNPNDKQLQWQHQQQRRSRSRTNSRNNLHNSNSNKQPMKKQRKKSTIPLLLCLPEEITLYVLSFLGSGEELCRGAALTNRYLYALSQENALWKRICELRWGPVQDYLQGYRWLKGLCWKQYYIQKSHLLKFGVTWEFPGMSGEVPSSRFVHTGTLAANDKIVFLGGKESANTRLDDLFLMDPKSRACTQPEGFKGKIPNIARHTACLMPGDPNKIIVIGGYGKEYFHGVSILDLATQSWHTIQTTGTAPRHRSNHAATVVGKKVYVYGGSSDGDDGMYILLGDLHVLDTETMEWTEITQKDVKGKFPGARAGHRMCTIRDKVFIFGGGVWDRSKHTWDQKLNELSVFDPEKKVWVHYSTPLPKKDAAPMPDACTFSSIFAIHDFMFVCFGQKVSQDTVSNSLWVLDTVQMKWDGLAPTRGGLPLARDMTSETYVEDLNKVFFLGGNSGGAFQSPDLSVLELPPYFCRPNSSFILCNKK